MNGGLKYLQLSNQPLTLDIAFKVAFFISCIQLTRTGNLHTVTVHFAPVGDPANGTCHCENDGEHGRRNTHRFQDDTRVEIDVRVQFLLDKVRVVQRDVFQLHSHFQQVILRAQLFQHFMAGFTHYGGARVVIFVHAVTEAHQAERIIFVLDRKSVV